MKKYKSYYFNSVYAFSLVKATDRKLLSRCKNWQVKSAAEMKLETRAFFDSAGYFGFN